jgi:hypothetical protein
VRGRPKAEMKLSQAEARKRERQRYSRMKHATLASVTTLLTGMPDAVEVLGGMSKGRCRRRCRTPRTRGMYYRLCCM